MRRKIYEKLLEWKKRSNGSSALLIEGARRVGKSWIVEEFAKREYEDYLLIDFSVVNDDVRDMFKYDLMNLDAFFRKLFAFYTKTLPVGESLIIFDEVQLFPRAREAIKHLVADGRYHYIELRQFYRAECWASYESRQDASEMLLGRHWVVT